MWWKVSAVLAHRRTSCRSKVFYSVTSSLGLHLTALGDQGSGSECYLPDLSGRSPLQSYMFIIQNDIFRIKVSNKLIFEIRNVIRSAVLVAATKIPCTWHRWPGVVESNDAGWMAWNTYMTEFASDCNDCSYDIIFDVVHWLLWAASLRMHCAI